MHVLLNAPGEFKSPAPFTKCQRSELRTACELLGKFSYLACRAHREARRVRGRPSTPLIADEDRFALALGFFIHSHFSVSLNKSFQYAAALFPPPHLKVEWDFEYWGSAVTSSRPNSKFDERHLIERATFLTKKRRKADRQFQLWLAASAKCLGCYASAEKASHRNFASGLLLRLGWYPNADFYDRVSSMFSSPRLFQ
jgi:hypothetical protein